MNFLQKIFGKPQRPDPTEGWADFGGFELEVEPGEKRVGFLHFGDPLSAAERLGKPSSFEWLESEYCELVYRQGGFQIDFDEGKLAFLAVYIDEHVLVPDGKVCYSEPVAVLPGGRRVELSKKTTAADLVEWFGQPESIDKDSDETILFYKGSPMMMEFELRPETHTLARWNLYPTEDEEQRGQD